MEPRTVMASTFKQQCLALLDQVETTKVSIVVTKRGRPVAQLVPLPTATSGQTTMGTVRLLATDDDAYFSTNGAWEADAVTPPP